MQNKFRWQKAYDNMVVVDNDTPNNNVGYLPYKYYTQFRSIIKSGDIESFYNSLSHFWQSEEPLIVGKMSNNRLEQFKQVILQFAFSTTLYAIEGGMSESKAFGNYYNFANKLLSATTPQEIDDAISLYDELILDMRDLITLPTDNNYIIQCQNYIADHIGEKITRTMLAQLVGISSGHLLHLFKQELNMSVSQYVMQQKINEAQKLLLLDNKISNVAYNLGFTSQSHFTQHFHKITGTTPRAYIANNGKYLN